MATVENFFDARASATQSSSAWFLAIALLLGLIVADISLTALHLYNKSHLNLPIYDISKDRSLPEYFQYAKEIFIAAGLAVVGSRTKQPVYFAWSALFAFLLLDDSFRIHERLGLNLADYLNFQPAFGLRAKDFGELVALGLTAGPLIGCVIGALLKSDGGARMESFKLFALLGLLALFGAACDMLHQMFRGHVLGVAEDGGEMLAMSLIVFFVWGLLARSASKHDDVEAQFRI